MTRHGRTAHVAWVLTVSLIALSGCARQESLPQYDLVDLGIPAGDESEAVDINDAGQVAGSFRRGEWVWHAFRWDNGTFEDLGLEPNLAFNSRAAAINSHGWVAGWYETAGIIRTMVWSTRTPRRSFPPFSYLPSRRGSEEFACGINDAGELVGWQRLGARPVPPTPSGVRLFSGSGAPVPRMPPGPPSSRAPAPPPEERPAAFRQSSLPLPFFLGYDEHQAFDINNAGVVVGRVKIKDGPWAGAFRACVWREGDVTVFGTLGGRESVAWRVSDSGLVAGEADRRSGDSEAVVWREGRLRALGTLGGRRSSAQGVNAAGDAVGWAQTDNGTRHAFLHRDGQMIDLNACVTDNGTWVLTEARAINDRGWIAGVGVAGGKPRAFLLKPPGDASLAAPEAPALQIPGPRIVAPVRRTRPSETPPSYEAIELGTLGGGETLPRDINDAGEVVGSSKDASGAWRPFHWDVGVMTDLSEDAHAESGEAAGINNAGAIVGYVRISRREFCMMWDPGNDWGRLIQPEDRNARAHAITANGEIVGVASRTWDWKEARTFNRDREGGGGAIDPPGGTAWGMDMNTKRHLVGRFTDEKGFTRPFYAEFWEVRPLGLLDRRPGYACAINEADHFVGQARSDDNTPQAFLYVKNQVTWLGTLGGRESAAAAINERDDVVGWAEDDNGARRAFLWRKGVMTDLNTMLAAADGWVLEEATGINGRGWIIGTGRLDNESCAFLLTAPGEMRRLVDERPAVIRWQRPARPSAAGPAIEPSAAPTTAKKSARSYDVFDLGTLGAAESRAAGLNNRDEVVGRLIDARGREQAFVWKAGVMRRLATPPNASGACAVAIDDAGLIAGIAKILSPTAQRAVIWKNGTPLDAGLPGGAQGGVVGISRSGRVVGSGERADKVWNPCFWEISPAGDVMPTRLKVFSQGTGWAGAVSLSGRIAGTAVYSANVVRLFRWDDGRVTDLGRLSYAAPVVTGVNDAGRIVGAGADASGAARGWVLDGSRAYLVGTFGGRSSRANAVAPDGCVVGWADDNEGMRRALLWDEGALVDLNECIDADAPWFLTEAAAVNGRGRIAGTGIVGNEVHAFLLIPRASPLDARLWGAPAAGLYAAVAVAALVVARRRRAKRLRSRVTPR